MRGLPSTQETPATANFIPPGQRGSPGGVYAAPDTPRAGGLATGDGSTERVWPTRGAAVGWAALHLCTKAPHSQHMRQGRPSPFAREPPWGMRTFESVLIQLYGVWSQGEEQKRW